MIITSSSLNLPLKVFLSPFIMSTTLVRTPTETGTTMTSGTSAPPS